jgi:hypothetical protein
MLWNGGRGGSSGGSNNIKEPSPVLILIDQKQLENVGYFNHLDSMITKNNGCTCEIKSTIALAKAPFNRKKALSTTKTGLKFKE